MTTSAESQPIQSDSRSRFGQPRHLAIVGFAVVIASVLVWKAVAVRQNVRIPLTGELSRQPAHEVEATFRDLGIENVSVDNGWVIVAASDEARCRQFLQESTADHATWADEWQRANEQLNPFSSASERSAAREIARARRISQMLSGMPGVQHADVVWDEQTGRGFRHESTVRATVYIRPTAEGQLTSQMVESIREAVAGSKANLSADDVIVMDLSTGMTHRVSAAMSEQPIAEVADAAMAVNVEPISTVSLPSQSPSVTRRILEARYGPLPHSWNHNSFGSSTYPEPPTSSMYPPPDIEEDFDRATTGNLASLHGNSSNRWSYAWFGSSLVSTADIDPTGARLNPHSRIDVGDDEYASSSDPGIPVTALPVQSPFDATEDSGPEIATESLSIADTPEWASDVVVPPRDRSAGTIAAASHDPAANGFGSRNDFRFLVWVGVGIIVLIAFMKGLRGGSDFTPPDLSISARPLQANTIAAGDTADSQLKSDSERLWQAEQVESPLPASHAGSRLPEAFATDESHNSAPGVDPLHAFEHLGWLDAETIQKLYRCLPDEPWALALSGASTQIQEHVLKSLSRSASIMLQRRMDSLPAIRLRDVEDAQRRLGEWICKLDEAVDVG